MSSTSPEPDRARRGPRLRPIKGGGLQIKVDKDGKLKLPASPPHDDPDAQAAWLTAAFDLDVHHPINRGYRRGNHGPTGQVHLYRLDARRIDFEPASRINSPKTFWETLSWARIPTDGTTRGYTNEHCGLIVPVVNAFCDSTEAITADDETLALIVGFLNHAEPVEGHTTYGNSGQRYEAAEALRRDPAAGNYGVPRYLIDTQTGEYVLDLSDLEGYARPKKGRLERGWLDARLDALGWDRFELQGFLRPGREGRRGPHARRWVYRGLLPRDANDDEDDPVYT